MSASTPGDGASWLVGGMLLDALARHDLPAMAQCLDPGVRLRVLGPDGSFQADGVGGTLDVFRTWFDAGSGTEVVDAAIGQFGTRLYLRWRTHPRTRPALLGIRGRDARGGAGPLRRPVITEGVAMRGEQVDVVVVGAGQAGLSISHELSAAGREHVVLERGRVAQAWRDRWDGFHLVLPNWSINLAGQPYAGPEPDRYLDRDGLVDYIAGYAATIDAPVREGVSVTSLRRYDGGFDMETSSGPITAREVVLASGGYQKQHVPAAVHELPPSIKVIGIADYRNPDALPDGDVLIIGSGQSGCQIAEELHLSGRDVVLACGRAPWLPRRIGDDDVFRWMVDGGMMNATVADLPSPASRLLANPQASGVSGGHDLHFRTLRDMGITLVGHLAGADEGQIVFAADLDQSVAFGDARYNDLRELVARTAREHGKQTPDLPPPPPFEVDAPAQLDARRFTTAIVATGYRPDYRSWVDFDDAFDDLGYPVQRDGSSTVVPGLHFIGVHYQRCRGSATLYGVGADAAVLGRRLTRNAAK